MVSEERKEELKEMRLLDHLEELRSALIGSLIAWTGSLIVIWFFSGRILDLLIHALPVEKLYFYSPAEAFMIRMKLSFILAILVAFPYVFFRIWRFISPGLFRRERGLVLPLIILSGLLFYAGLFFAYFVMMPLVLTFFIEFGTPELEPLLSVEKYFGFVTRLCFVFGLVFQLPIVIIFLTWTRVLSARVLIARWRWAIIIIFVVAAVLTPPDPVSQVFMALPLCLLFFTSVIAALFIEKGRRKHENSDS